MTKLKLFMCASAASLGLAWAGAAAADTAPAAPAAPAPPAPTPMANPAMGPTISANPHPGTFDAGPFGNIVVDGAISGMVMWQSPVEPQPPFSGNPLKVKDTFYDVTNAQVIINKSDGPIQFYLQAGAYSFPTLGSPYITAHNTEQTVPGFGYLPQGFLKIVPNSNISIEAGALPTLIGAELGFTFQNMNIERGLLWNTEPLVSKGVQVNVTEGPWAFSVAVTDGYYTNKYTNVSGLVTYTFKNSDTLTFAAEGNTSNAPNGFSPLASGEVYNLIFTHTQGPWTITPYFQYQNSPNGPTSISGSLWAGAILAKYSFNAEWSLSGRVEYESSSGAANLLGYGPGSNAWSITITPTYQKGIWYARPEFSYTGIGNYVHATCTTDVSLCLPGLGFGRWYDQSGEVRLALETGFVF